MLHGLLALFLVLGRADRAPAVARSSGSFQITPQLIRTISEAEMLRDCDRKGSMIRGCMGVVGETLSMPCEATAGGWSIELRGHARALIFVRDPQVVLHELKHLQDLRRSIDVYVDQIGAVEYSTKPECETAAVRAARDFRHTLRNMAAESSRKRN